MGRNDRETILARVVGIAMTSAIVAVAVSPATARAQGGAALVSKPLDEMARPNPLQGLPQGAQNMAKNFADGGGAPAPDAAAAPPVDATPPPEVPLITVKYIPAYFITVLAAGLGLFTVCKFSGRRRDV